MVMNYERDPMMVGKLNLVMLSSISRYLQVTNREGISISMTYEVRTYTSDFQEVRL